MPTIPSGATSAVPLSGHTGFISSGFGSPSWNIFHSGSLIASDSSPAGWNVAYRSGGYYNITVPSGVAASTGNAYEFRITPALSNADLGTSYSEDTGHFDVGAASGSAKSHRLNVQSARSHPLNVTYPHPQSHRLNVYSARSHRLNVSASAQSHRLNVESSVSAPADIYEAPYTLTWDGGNGIVFALRDGVRLTEPLIIVPYLTSAAGLAQVAAFTPGAIQLSNNTRNVTVTVVAALLGWGFVGSHHTGYNIYATPAPTAIFFAPLFADGTPACSGLDFAGTSRTGQGDEVTFSCDINGTFGRAVSGQIDLFFLAPVNPASTLGYNLRNTRMWHVTILFAENTFEAYIEVANRTLGDTSNIGDLSALGNGGGSFELYRGYPAGTPHISSATNPDGTPVALDTPGTGSCSFSGRVSAGMQFDEVKGVSGQLATSGYGEPSGTLQYDANTPPGYPCHFNSSFDWFWGPLYYFDGDGNRIVPNSTLVTSLGFGLNEAWEWLDPDGNVVDPFTYWDNWQETHHNTDYPPLTKRKYINNTGLAYTPHGTAAVAVSTNCAVSHEKTEISYTDVPIQKQVQYTKDESTFNLVISNITFDSGMWAPVPYDGSVNGGHNGFVGTNDYVGYAEAVYDYGNISLSASPGNLTLSGAGNADIQVNGAARGTVHLEGRLYNGDVLETGNTLVGFAGSILTARNGVLSADVPQIYSKFYGSGFSPPLPATRYDFGAHTCTLYSSVPVGAPAVLANDAICFLLDDVSWPVTQLSHAPETLVESFNTLTDWTVNAFGTKRTAAPLAVTSSDALCQVTSKVNWNKDWRAYRYLRLVVEASIAGGHVRLVLPSGRSFTSKTLVVGMQTLEFDLCKPDGGLGPSATRTGWDTSPDAIYGVGGVSQLKMDSFAVGQTVTFHSLTLNRKGATVKGRALIEQMPGPGQPFTSEWFPPDVPVSSDTSPDDTLTGLGSPHKRYGRVLAARVDGKQGVDLPHAIELYPFLDGMGNPWQQVLSRDRIAICQMIALGNSIPGLSLSPAKALSQPAKQVNGVWTPVYSGANPAAYLTFDGGDGLTPGSLDTDLLQTPMLARPYFLTVAQYPGQRLNSVVKFMKRRHGSIEGLVVNPNGGGAGGVKVTGTSLTVPVGQVLTATADADGYYRLPTFQNQRVQAATSDTSANGYTRNRAYRWLGLTGHLPTANKVCCEIDSARGWLLLGVDKHISAFHLSDYSPVFDSPDYTDEAFSVDSWKALRYDPRFATLAMLGKSGSSYKLGYSRDDGLSGTQVDTMTVNSILLLNDSENGLFVLLYENDDSNSSLAHKVYRRVSTDGGASYGDPEVVKMDGNPLQCVLLDRAQDTRAGSIMVIVVQKDDNILVLESKTKGLDWKQQLSM